jgi:hypothetical protein
MAASVSWNFFELISNGINLSKFNSIAAHRNIQLDEDIAIIELVNIIIDDRKINGDI